MHKMFISRHSHEQKNIIFGRLDPLEPLKHKICY